MMKWIVIFCFSFLVFACQTAVKQEQKDAPPAQEDVVEYYANGLKKVEGEHRDGLRHGVWTYYYENGMKWSEGRYKNGVRDGYSIVYYENGRKKLEGQYEQDLQVGIWKVWNDDGSLVTEIDLNEKLSSEDSLKLGLK